MCITQLPPKRIRKPSANALVERRSWYDRQIMVRKLVET